MPCATKVAKTKKEASSCGSSTSSTISSNKIPFLQNVKTAAVVFPKATCVPGRVEDAPKVVAPVAVPVSSSGMDVSPSKSDGVSVSMSVDETMSSCDSFKSPDIEYLDNSDISAVDSIERKTFSNLNISDTAEPAG